MKDELLVLMMILSVADNDQPRTVYHDRIDGLILPTCEPLPFSCFWPI